MAKVLVVEDDTSYREALAGLLSQQEHTIATASSGKEALGVGLRFDTEVLIVDWMLKNEIHGFHVSSALRLVHPKLQTILITGFPSADLARKSRKEGMFRYLTKPFEMWQLEMAVKDAAEHEKPPSEFSVGVLVTDAEGVIQVANQKAREILSETEAGRDATRLSEVLAQGGLPHLEKARSKWVQVQLRTSPPRTCYVRERRGKANSDACYLLLQEWETSYQEDLRLVHLLQAVGPHAGASR